jgi:FkbM family methyltransferase
LLSAEQPEAHVVRWIVERLPRGGTFFDVGAHYGWLSMIAAQQAGPSATIVAFEASPVLSRIASFHKKVNRLSQMEVIEKAVSHRSEEGLPFFLINEGLSFRNSLMIGAAGTPYLATDAKMQIQVPGITIDKFVASSGVVPDLIKVDVEGAELLVLQGAREVLATHHPDIILGVHPFWLPDADSIGQILELLRSLQYEITDENVVPFDGSYLADYLCIWRRRNK